MRVDAQVQHQLRSARGIHLHLQRRLRRNQLQRHPRTHEAPGQRRCILDHLVEVEDLNLLLRVPAEGQQLLGQPRSAHGRGVHLVQPRPGLGRQLVVHQRQADIATDRQQQVVKVMRDSHRQRTDRPHLLRLEQLVLNSDERRVVRHLVNQPANLPLMLPRERAHHPVAAARIHGLQLLRTPLCQHGMEDALQLRAPRRIWNVIEQRAAHLRFRVDLQPPVLCWHLRPAIVEMGQPKLPIESVKARIQRVDDAANKILLRLKRVVNFTPRADVTLEGHRADQLTAVAVDRGERHLHRIAGAILAPHRQLAHPIRTAHHAIQILTRLARLFRRLAKIYWLTDRVLDAKTGRGFKRRIHERDPELRIRQDDDIRGRIDRGEQTLSMRLQPPSTAGIPDYQQPAPLIQRHQLKVRHQAAALDTGDADRADRLRPVCPATQRLPQLDHRARCQHRAVKERSADRDAEQPDRPAVHFTNRAVAITNQLGVVRLHKQMPPPGRMWRGQRRARIGRRERQGGHGFS